MPRLYNDNSRSYPGELRCILGSGAPRQWTERARNPPRVSVCFYSPSVTAAPPARGDLLPRRPQGPLRFPLFHPAAKKRRTLLKRPNAVLRSAAPTAAFHVQQEPQEGPRPLEDRVRRGLPRLSIMLRCYPFLWFWHFHVGEDQLLKFRIF